MKLELKTKQKLPPNPFCRTPVTNIDMLSGRSRELSEIDYLFARTAAGFASSCVLIGNRGIGKTSLLKCSAGLAKQHGLAIVEICLDKSKIKDLRSFWNCLYIAITHAGGKLGCWGGRSDPAYTAMISSLTQPAEQDGFQLPRFWNDSSSCLDAVIRDDLNLFQAELLERGFPGAVIFIDEADLMAKKDHHLQSVRAVFEGLPGISLVLAGTPTIFSTSSEHSSPIPRQFHNIEVSGFSHWSDTQSLIKLALGEHFDKLGPSTKTILELHSLCAGDPSEIQLYCHYMFKNVELGKTEEMELNSSVYHAVAHSYRSSTSSNSLKAMKALGGITKNYIPDCPWFQNFSLSASESVQLYRARAEFESATELSLEESNALANKIKESYQHLYRLGISRDEDAVRLHDEGCLKGFWKTSVRLAADQQWQWRSSNLSTILVDDIHALLKEKTAAAHSSVLFDAQDIFGDVYGTLTGAETGIPDLWKQAEINRKILSTTRITADTDRSLLADVISGITVFCKVLDCILVVTRGFNEEHKNLCRIPVTVEHDGVKATHVLTYFSSDDPTEEKLELRFFKQAREALLSKHEISVDIGKPQLFRMPKFNQLTSGMAQIGCRLPLSPTTLWKAAIELVNEQGDVDEASKCFEEICKQIRNPHILNNIGFCKILLGQTSTAKSLIEEAIQAKPHPLFWNNLAIIAHCENDNTLSMEMLEAAWELMAKTSFYSEKTISMLIIKAEDRQFEKLDNLPLGIGLALSKCRLRPEVFAQVDDELKSTLPPLEVEQWQEISRSFCRSGDSHRLN
jgi:tetratricopeptide (TPR) repeat protein